MRSSTYGAPPKVGEGLRTSNRGVLLFRAKYKYSQMKSVLATPIPFGMYKFVRISATNVIQILAVTLRNQKKFKEGVGGKSKQFSTEPSYLPSATNLLRTPVVVYRFECAGGLGYAPYVLP